MNEVQLRAMANYLRDCQGGADSVLKMLEQARKLAPSGELKTAEIWNRVADEISRLETSAELDRCLEREN